MTMLLAAVAGACLALIACLLVVRSTQAASASQNQFAKDVLALTIQMIADNEREISRDRSLDAMAKALSDLGQKQERLDLSVGNLVLRQKAAERTVIERALQVGEAPPGSPWKRVTRDPQPPPMQDGMEDEEPTSPPDSHRAATETRKSAFAKPT